MELLKRYDGVVTLVRRRGAEVRWTSEGEVPGLVAALRRVAGQLERRRRSAYAAPRIIVPAPTAEQLALLRKVAGDGSMLDVGDGIGLLVEHGWLEAVPGKPSEYRLTVLGRRWAEPVEPPAA